MTSAQRQLIGVAECLPHLALPRADTAAPVSWSHGTQASVLVFPHLQPCSECARYLEELSGRAEDLRLWGTRLLVVVPAGEDRIEPSGRARYTVLSDENSVARARIGVCDNDVAVIVGDRWGAVYHVSAAGADHCLPDPRYLVELAKFIDIQCPECGVPGPEWRLSCPLPLG